MSYYPEPHSHIRGKIKVVSDLSNYAAKKELQDATGINSSNSAAKKRFYCLESWSWQTRYWWSG